MKNKKLNEVEEEKFYKEEIEKDEDGVDIIKMESNNSTEELPF